MSVKNVGPTKPLVEDKSERRAREAEERVQRAQQKGAARCARAKANEKGTYLDLYFVSVTKCGHACIHVVHEEFTPFRLNNCNCSVCNTPEDVIHDFIKAYDGLDEFVLVPVSGHPSAVLVHVKKGQPCKDGHQIYPVELDKVVPKKCQKPLSQAIWQAVEEIRAGKASSLSVSA